MEKRQLQCTYCPKSQEVTAIRDLNFGQLIEYNRRNIFLEKSYTKCFGKTIPKPFSKKSKLSMSVDQ